MYVHKNEAGHTLTLALAWPDILEDAALKKLPLLRPAWAMIAFITSRHSPWSHRHIVMLHCLSHTLLLLSASHS